MTSHPFILSPLSIILASTKYHRLLLGFPDTSQAPGANTRVVSVANFCQCHGVVGWERLQGHMFIKEGEEEPVSSKQASAGRREEDPTAPRQAT